METNNLFNQQYNLPEDRDEFVDMSSGEIVGREKIDPFDVIRKVAEKTGTKIQDPKKNCKHCYGRGYTARDAKTKSPIPCSCIYPKLEGDAALERQYIESQFAKPSRKERRTMAKLTRKSIKKNKKRKNGKVRKK